MLISHCLLVDVHALLAWFDIQFRASHKPVQFSTGPHAEYTRESRLALHTSHRHLIRYFPDWKQTVFYLRETLAVNVSICPLSESTSLR